jgi:hypothetical protein
MVSPVPQNGFMGPVNGLIPADLRHGSVTGMTGNRLERLNNETVRP